jgi:GT2 family glycosyltransferase
MRVSILHWNRPVECLTTIANLRESGLPLEITVVDNQSKPENLERLRAELPEGVEVITLPQNVGWGPAHNVVIRRWLETEKSDYCIVAAHDALAQDDCLAKLVKAIEQHPDWGMVCPEYGEPTRPRFNPLRGATLEHVTPRAPGTHEEVEFCHGTLAMFRRQCLSEIGVYDEGYFAYGDEAEIGIRARRKGWKVGLVWGAVLINPGSWSGGPVIAYLWTRNSLKLARSFGGFLGMVGRLAVVLLATFREKLQGALESSMSSPKARLIGIRDYFRGYCGGPPQEVLRLRS